MATEVKKGPQRPKAVVDTSIVDDKRIAELRTKAKAKVDLERKQAAEAQLLAQFELEERQQGGLDEPMVDITIDLAPHADRIVLDSVIYFQGQTKTVRESVAAVIAEVCSKTWEHQSQIDGKSENFYRKARGQRVTPDGVVSNILRA